MGRRLALLIATYSYRDTGLRQLAAPTFDVEALAAVLRDPAIAGFDVTTLINEPHHVAGEAISDFYRVHRHDDLTLLYFTGHGLTDDDGRLYLAMSNTRRDSLLFTSLPAEQLDQAMQSSRSRQVVLILDCCYSGAFPAGPTVKADTRVHALEKLQGRGRTVLTASDSMQYSFEGDHLHGARAGSVFTRHLVEGLREGSADLDGDGDITLDELYAYVHDRVVEEMPQQRPKIQANVEGRTIIARNINWRLPDYLRHALNSPVPADRLVALDGLEHLHRTGNETVRARVRDEIHRLTEDDSRMVAAAATSRLQAMLSSRVKPPPRAEPPSVPPPEPMSELGMSPTSSSMTITAPPETHTTDSHGTQTPVGRRPRVAQPLSSPARPGFSSPDSASESSQLSSLPSPPTANVANRIAGRIKPITARLGAELRSHRRSLGVLAAVAAVIALIVVGVDMATGARSASTGVTSVSPHRVGISPDGRTAYVTTYSGISIVNTASNTVTSKIPVPATLLAIAPDGHHLYVVVADGRYTVSVIDTATKTVIATIPLSFGLLDLAVAPDGRHVYAVNLYANAVTVIDTTSNTVTATISVGERPVSIGIAPDGRHAYISHSNSGVSVIDTVSKKVTATIPFNGYSDGVDVTPDGRRVYIPVNDAERSAVLVIDTSTNSVTATIPVPVNGTDVVITPDGRHAYIASYHATTVIDTVSNTVTATIPTVNSDNAVNGNKMAITPDGRYIYITNSLPDLVAVIDTTSNAVTARIPIT